MEQRRRIALVLVFVLLFGFAVIVVVQPFCSPFGIDQPQWELEVWVYEERALDENDTELDVGVLVSGQAGSTIHDVRLAFEDSDGQVYRTVEVGTLSGLANETRTVRLNRKPSVVRVETGPIEKGNDDAEYWIKGVQQANGEYEQFIQEHQEC